MNINISYTLLHVSGVFELWSFKGKVRMLLLPNSDLTNINIYKRCSLLRIRSSMYACMYVCMHACIHVCMHTYIHAYMYTCMLFKADSDRSV